MFKPRRKVSKRQELREDTVVTFYARALMFYDQYKKPLIAGIAVVLIAALGFIGYQAYVSTQNAEAQERLGEVIGLYEQGQYQQALEGGSGTMGLLAIADEYGITEAGDLARFYAADAFYNLGNYERALELFEAYDIEENYLGASAAAGMAASYVNLEQHQKAAEQYEKAATIYESQATSPMYLFNAAENYEKAGELAQARALYEQVQEQYPESSQAQQVPMQLARLSVQTEK